MLTHFYTFTVHTDTHTHVHNALRLCRLQSHTLEMQEQNEIIHDTECDLIYCDANEKNTSNGSLYVFYHKLRNTVPSISVNRSESVRDGEK